MKSEEYWNDHEAIEKQLDFSSDTFNKMSYINGQLQGLTSNAMERISKAAKEGTLEEIQKELAELDETKKTFDTMKMHSPMALEITTGKVKDFLKKFGLERYIVLHESMLADDIKRAIELGYEARMWELTNDLED